MAFHEPEGIVAYVRELNSGKTPVHDPIYFKGTVDKVEVEAAIQFVDTFEENILGFATTSLPGGRPPIWPASRPNSRR